MPEIEEISTVPEIDEISIWSDPGTRVRFARPHAGFQCDVDFAAKHLESNSIYIIEKIDVHNCHSNLYLEGLPGCFNSCHFDNVDPVDHEALKLNQEIWNRMRGW